MTPSFPQIQNANAIPSPCLVICPERIAANIEQMIKIAGGAHRLRPHVKTHKMREIVAMQREQGIEKFKCATHSELRMLLESGAKDILLAMQPVGPAGEALVDCAARYPDRRLSTLVDNPSSLQSLKIAARQQPEARLGVYLDVNNGMNRTGIAPGPDALTLYRALSQSQNLDLRGLHIYDGHIRDRDISERTDHANRDFGNAEKLIRDIAAVGLEIPNLVVGGSPSFPTHTERKVDLSPGTTLLWDFGYGEAFSDLPFDYAAALFTRVVSKPSPGLLCFDLGHKAVASEMEPPRVRILGIEDASFVSHSEEHLVIATDNADRFSVGDSFYAIPKHICPTVALHNKAAVIRDGKAEGYWEIAARDRILD